MLTIDLEDYFMVSAFEKVVKREEWERYDSRIERNTYRLLEILDESGSAYRAKRLANELAPCASPHTPNRIKATFFCLAWVAERYPGLIKEIHREGHEIASHGYNHRLVYEMAPYEFRLDVRKSKRILEDKIGEDVIGYRAPSYSITKKSLWALEILAEEGYHYDSSIFPIHHDRYGIPDAPRFPFLISMNGNSVIKFDDLNLNSEVSLHSAFRNPRCSTPSSGLPTLKYLLEFPLSTIRLGGMNIPISGGGYFRLFPYSSIKKRLTKINRMEGMPFIFYLHPWEIDPEQPRIDGISRKSRFRHYVNIGKTENRFSRILSDFRLSSILDVLNSNTAPLRAAALADNSTIENEPCFKFRRFAQSKSAGGSQLKENEMSSGYRSQQSKGEEF